MEEISRRFYAKSCKKHEFYINIVQRGQNFLFRIYTGQGPDRSSDMETTCTACGRRYVDKSRRYRPMCPECRERYSEEYERNIQAYTKLKSYFRIERAKRCFEKSVHYDEWGAAMDVVEEYIFKNPKKADSTEEVVVIAALIGSEITVKPQERVGNMRVDMVLPDDKIVVEVDGPTHNHTKERDERRDACVRKILGSDWDVVRLPTEFINKHPGRIADAVYYVRKAQRELRKRTGGAIKMPSNKILKHMLDGLEARFKV